MAFAPDDTVVVWHFTVEGEYLIIPIEALDSKAATDSVPIEVYSQSLLNLCFSGCGEYLCGKSGNDRPLVVINVTSVIRDTKKLLETDCPIGSLYKGSDDPGAHASLAVGRRLTNSNPNTTMTSQQPKVSLDRDQAKTFGLEMSHDTGSIELTC